VEGLRRRDDEGWGWSLEVAYLRDTGRAFGSPTPAAAGGGFGLTRTPEFAKSLGNLNPTNLILSRFLSEK